MGLIADGGIQLPARAPQGCPSWCWVRKDPYALNHQPEVRRDGSWLLKALEMPLLRQPHLALQTKPTLLPYAESFPFFMV